MRRGGMNPGHEEGIEYLSHFLIPSPGWGT